MDIQEAKKLLKEARIESNYIGSQYKTLKASVIGSKQPFGTITVYEGDGPIIFVDGKPVVTFV